jgi:hypothetical protein
LNLQVAESSLELAKKVTSLIENTLFGTGMSFCLTEEDVRATLIKKLEFLCEASVGGKLKAIPLLETEAASLEGLLLDIKSTQEDHNNYLRAQLLLISSIASFELGGVRTVEELHTRITDAYTRIQQQSQAGNHWEVRRLELQLQWLEEVKEAAIRTSLLKAFYYMLLFLIFLYINIYLFIYCGRRTVLRMKKHHLH